MADLLGRHHDLRLIDALLTGRDGPTPGLLLRGEPGVGKTALLHAAAAGAEAAGMRVLRASGVRFEAGIGLAALHQVLYPLRAHADRLAYGHRAAVRRALGLAEERSLAEGGLADPLDICAAVLALLTEVAADRPLLLAIDDVAWIDPASATVLGFVARRSAGAPLRVLAAANSDAGGIFAETGLLEWDVAPLADQPAEALLDATWPELAPAVRRRLLVESAGNPLALVDLPAPLTVRQRCGEDAAPEFLPLSPRLETAFGADVRALPSATKRLLLLAALESDANVATIFSAAQGRADFDDLEPARRAHVVDVHTNPCRLVFRRPLSRSALVQVSSPNERRSAHLALAAVPGGTPERRARHLAEAALGPEEAVAQALEEAAVGVSWHGGAGDTVAALLRAADLSPDPADRSRRLVEAAYVASGTGPLDRATQLLAEARRADDGQPALDGPTGLVLAAATAVHLMNGHGNLDTAHALLARALDQRIELDAGNREQVREVLYGLMFACLHADRPELWTLLGNALARFDPEGATPLRLCFDAFTDPAANAHRVRAELAKAFADLPAAGGSWRLVPLAYAALRVDALSEHRHLLRAMVARERDSGGTGLVVAGLLLLSGDSFHRGRWDEAESLAHQGLDLAMAQGYQLQQRQLLCHLAFIAAARGNVSLARALSDEITTWAAPRGITVTQSFARYARVIAALGQGDYEEAYVQGALLVPPDTPMRGVLGPWMVMDLVESAVRTGRVEQARAHLAVARAGGIGRISPRIALVDAGAAALVADDDRAGSMFEAALSAPGADRFPFEFGRVHLAYGQWLRRTRDTARARVHLHAALETLDRLGAWPWVQRARDELRASGVVTNAPAGSLTVELTAQEQQVATLAATGLTNKQIGQRLFLSHRTVGAHLHRLFPKLGVTSRAALRDALERVTFDDGSGPGSTARAAGNV